MCITVYCIIFIIINPNLGYGVFVTEDVPKGRFLDEYADERITPKEVEKKDRK